MSQEKNKLIDDFEKDVRDKHNQLNKKLLEIDNKEKAKKFKENPERLPEELSKGLKGELKEFILSQSFRDFVSSGFKIKHDPFNNLNWENG